MKVIQISLTLLCLSFLTEASYSPINIGMTMENQQEIWRQESKEASKNSLIRGYWIDGDVMAASALMSSLQDPKERAVLGISDKYYQEIQESMRIAAESVSVEERRKVGQEYLEAMQALGLSPHRLIGQTIDIQRLDEEGLKAYNRYRDMEGRMESMRQEFDAEVEQRTLDAISNAITPELKQKLLEAQLVGMLLEGDRVPQMISLSKLEALNLTDTQRQRMERIRDELGPEFERCIELRIEESSLRIDKENAAMMRSIKPGGPGDEDPEDRRKRILDATKEVDDDPEWQKVFEESQSSNRAFATLFKTRMTSVLTDEQRQQLQELIDNPPLHVRLFIQRVMNPFGASTGTNEEGTSKKAEGDKDVWSPGPDSWKPGDPLPDWFRQEENTGRGFPREEK